MLCNVRLVTEVPDAEVYFQMDEFDDLAQTSKPIVYISAEEMFAMHALLESNMDYLVCSAVMSVGNILGPR